MEVPGSRVRGEEIIDCGTKRAAAPRATGLHRSRTLEYLAVVASFFVWGEVQGFYERMFQARFILAPGPKIPKEIVREQRQTRLIAVVFDLVDGGMGVALRQCLRRGLWSQLSTPALAIGHRVQGRGTTHQTACL